MDKDKINIVWFKRDLRISDHAPLEAAAKQGGLTVLLYILDPDYINDTHYSARHWQFVRDCLKDMARKFKIMDHKLTPATPKKFILITENPYPANPKKAV